MHVHYRHIVVLLLSSALLSTMTGCHTKTSSEDTTSNIVAASTSETPNVETLIVRPTLFLHEIVSNGKLSAKEYVDMCFASTTASINNIYISNGQPIKQGQILASLDKFKLENALSTAQNALDRSKLDLADALIGQGYDPEKQSEIPDEVMRLARLRSGVAQAEVQLREAERALDDATLRAPFDGVIANLFQKAGNLPDTSQPFCRIIATNDMDVIFPILESELALVKVGDAVEVKPYSMDKTYAGKVSSINPIVEKDGMVKVCATISNGTGLYDGMNVRVSVKRQVEEALVVPKSAVVLRSGGRQVVFTHENGKAMWNYVTTSLENMNEYVITEGLTPGQEVIVTGNINLAHESPVRVVND